MKIFTESDRYDYPRLTPQSIVIDCGAHKGQWASAIAERYGCTVHAYEPVPVFSLTIDRHPKHGRVIVHSFAVGGEARMERIHVQGDSSGMFATAPDSVEIPVMPIRAVLADFTDVDLIKLNVEGMEFEILEDVIRRELARKLRNIQVQFHTCAPAFDSRYGAIREALLKTHHLTFDAPWCWQNFERNE